MRCNEGGGERRDFVDRLVHEWQHHRHRAAVSGGDAIRDGVIAAGTMSDGINTDGEETGAGEAFKLTGMRECVRAKAVEPEHRWKRRAADRRGGQQYWHTGDVERLKWNGHTLQATVL